MILGMSFTILLTSFRGFESFRFFMNSSATTLTLKNETITMNHKEYPKTRAVVHMGIHKTGTTSIQMETSNRVTLLESDGYLMPWTLAKAHTNQSNASDHPCEKSVYGELKLIPNQARFATCFFSKSNIRRREKPCIEALLCYGSEIAKKGKNLLISTETFDLIDKAGLKQLSTYLSQWDETTIIVYHRRFYKWIVSIYNQRMKKHDIQRRAQKPIVDFVTAVMKPNSTTEYYCPECLQMYSYNLVQQLQENFANNIVLMNYDDTSKGDSVESFFCHALPGAKNTCDAIRKDTEHLKLNKAGPMLDYKDLVYGAMQAKLIHTSKLEGEGMNALALATKKHQEEVYNTTKKNLKRICPERDVLDLIWEFSLLSEKTLFPHDFRNTSVAEASMKADFEEIAHTALCKLDIDKILNEPSWQTFFKNL